jgi:Transposase domain (DUF772)/Transposase DDE domain
MYKRSSKHTETEIFAGISQHLEGRKLKKYNDKQSWHNIFHEHITSKIDEDKFEVLFSDAGQGRPNASIRILISMMIVKEGFGWSDKQLFERSEYDVLVMRALGLNNINDLIPSEATYYNLKKAIYEHQIETGSDLIGEVFRSLTKEQIDLFGVTGEYSRMDSTLLGSNIAKSSRLQLVINVLQAFYKDIKGKLDLISRLSQEDKELLELISDKKSGQIIYTLDNLKREELLLKTGNLLLRIQTNFKEDESKKYHLIVRVLSEQYTIESDKVILKPVKEVSSKSLQSAEEEDAEYRNKNGEKVQGYVANITETANEEGLNLITDPKVKGATASDPEFFQEGIERSEALVGKISNVNTDGAFHSPANQEFTEVNNINFILSAMQGKEGIYAFTENQQNEIEIINTQTGEVLKTEITKSGKYKITDGDKTRYFSQKEITAYNQRQQMKSIPQKEKNRRNNVEATIFQLVYYTRNKKTRYRGLIKHQMWAFCRCLWINMVRIKNWIEELYHKGAESVKNQVVLTKISDLLTILLAFLIGKRKTCLTTN